MRIRAVTMDGETVMIAPLSWDEADDYIKQGQEMLKRDPPATQNDWAMRTLESVCFTLNKAAAKNGNGNGNAAKWDPKKLASEMDMLMIQHIYSEFMKISGLKTATMGEAQATLPTS